MMLEANVLLVFHTTLSAHREARIGRLWLQDERGLWEEIADLCYGAILNACLFSCGIEKPAGICGAQRRPYVGSCGANDCRCVGRQKGLSIQNHLLHGAHWGMKTQILRQLGRCMASNTSHRHLHVRPSLGWLRPIGNICHRIVRNPGSSAFSPWLPLRSTQHPEPARALAWMKPCNARHRSPQKLVQDANSGCGMTCSRANAKHLCSQQPSRGLTKHKIEGFGSCWCSLWHSPHVALWLPTAVHVVCSRSAARNASQGMQQICKEAVKVQEHSPGASSKTTMQEGAVQHRGSVVGTTAKESSPPFLQLLLLPLHLLILLLLFPFLQILLLLLLVPASLPGACSLKPNYVCWKLDCPQPTIPQSRARTSVWLQRLRQHTSFGSQSGACCALRRRQADIAAPN